MMRDLPHRFARMLAAAMFSGSICVVGLAPMASWAQRATQEPAGTTAPAADTGTLPVAPPEAPIPKSDAHPPAVDPMAQRINDYLHARLRITPAQEPLWAALTLVMQGNATALAPLLKAQFQARQGGNSIQMLIVGEKLNEAQLDGLRKFIVAYQALYNSMSDEQKKIADGVFRRSQSSGEPIAAASAPVVPPYLPPQPPPDYATLSPYPAYNPPPYFPDYGPLFNVPYVGVAVAPRLFLHGHPGVQNSGFPHAAFRALPPPIHMSLPPPIHVGAGPARIGAPPSHR